MAGCLLLVASADAARVHPFVSSFRVPGAEAVPPQGLAVAEGSHDVYAAYVRGTQSEGGIYRFDGSGALIDRLSLPVGFRPQFLAVDNSAGPMNGYLYATQGNSFGRVGDIRQFDPSGVATSVNITSSALPANGTPQAGGSPVVNKGEFDPRGVAIGPTGQIFVADFANGAVDEFSPSGAFVEQLGADALPETRFFSGGIAVSSAGNIYLGGGLGLYELTPSGACVNACSPITPLGLEGVAVDSAGNVVVTVLGAGVREYDPTGNLVSVSEPEQLTLPTGVALDSSTGTIYVGAGPAFKGTVARLGPLVTTPNAATGSATGVTSTGAVLHGTVGADGGPAVTCNFQYVTAETFQESGFTGAPSAPCEPAGPFTGPGEEEVTASISRRPTKTGRPTAAKGL
jgi:DNA-binding beta-propeller fold protein YncE